jgi:hypothetical protein
LSVEFCNRGSKDRALARENEESQLLEALAKERLMKTQQAGNRLRGSCGDLYSVEIRGNALIPCISEWSIEASNKSIEQSVSRL